MIDYTNYWEDDDKFLLYEFSDQADCQYFGEDKVREWAKMWIHEAIHSDKRSKNEVFVNSAAIIADSFLSAWGI